jgi:hypothetical protein
MVADGRIGNVDRLDGKHVHILLVLLACSGYGKYLLFSGR